MAQFRHPNITSLYGVVSKGEPVSEAASQIAIYFFTIIYNKAITNFYYTEKISLTVIIKIIHYYHGATVCTSLITSLIACR